MSKPKRRRFTAEEKATILRRHLVDKVPISDLCDELGIQPSLVYTWQRQMLDNLAVALQDGRKTRAEVTGFLKEREKAEKLEAKLARKNEVIAEISQDLVDLKKTLGET